MSTPPDPHADLPEHPIGTLVIVLVYGALFVAGWLFAFFALYLPRGPVS